MSDWDEKAASGWAEFCKFFGPNPRHKKSAQRAYGTAWLDAKEALLSDEAVERAAWGIHASHDRGDWEHEPAEVLDEYLNMARAALTAALEGEQ